MRRPSEKEIVFGTLGGGVSLLQKYHAVAKFFGTADCSIKSGK